jgi:hypothetical protein
MKPQRRTIIAGKGVGSKRTSKGEIDKIDETRDQCSQSQRLGERQDFVNHTQYSVEPIRSPVPNVTRQTEFCSWAISGQTSIKSIWQSILNP